MAKDKRIWLLAAYLLLAFYLLPMFPHGGSANELTRWATAASLFEKGSFDIAWTEPLIGPNVDTAKVNSATYSNKAPGTALLATPFYAFTRVFIGEPDASNIRISWFVMRIAISTLPLFLLGFWLYRRDADAFSLATLLFASPLFVYSLLFFSHVFVAVVLYFAFRLLYDDAETNRRNYLYAGILCGLAVVSEFPALFVVAVLGIGLFFGEQRKNYRNVLWFVAGGLPSLVFLLLYNNALFGSPFSFSYAHESFPEWAAVAGQGVFGIGIPSLSNIFLLLLSPSRGLFFTAPVFLIAIYTAVKQDKPMSYRTKILLIAIGLTTLFMTGHGAAHGGWGFGPRYLVILMPLMLDPLFYGKGVQINGIVRGFAFAVSLLFCFIPALTFPFAPPEFTFPHVDFWGAFLFAEKWAVPNLSALLGFGNTIFSLVPAVAVAIGVVVITCITSDKPRLFLYGGAIAVVVIAGYFVAVDTNQPSQVLRRASIAERYYQPTGRLDKLDQNTAEEYKWVIADTRAYAPDDFPYLTARKLDDSPSMLQKRMVALQTQRKTDEAVALARSAAEKFPFAQCEFLAGAAVPLYEAGRKAEALALLEEVQPLVRRSSRSWCMRSGFLLGSLYQELGRPTEANAALTKFLNDSSASQDREIIGLRSTVQNDLRQSNTK